MNDSEKKEIAIYDSWSIILDTLNNKDAILCRNLDKTTCDGTNISELVEPKKRTKVRQICEWNNTCLPCIRQDHEDVYNFANGTGVYGRKESGKIGIPKILNLGNITNILKLKTNFANHVPRIPMHNHIRNLALELSLKGIKIDISFLEHETSDKLAYYFYLLSGLYMQQGNNYIAYAVKKRPENFAQLLELIFSMPISLGQKLKTLKELFMLEAPPEDKNSVSNSQSRKGKGSASGSIGLKTLFTGFLLFNGAGAAKTSSAVTDTVIESDTGSLQSVGSMTMQSPPIFNDRIFDDSSYNQLVDKRSTQANYFEIKQYFDNINVIKSNYNKVSEFLEKRQETIYQILGVNNTSTESSGLILLGKQLEMVSLFIEYSVYKKISKLLEMRPDLSKGEWTGFGVTIQTNMNSETVSKKSIDTLIDKIGPRLRRNKFNPSLFAIAAKMWDQVYTAVKIEDFVFPILECYFRGNANQNKLNIEEGIDPLRIEYLESRYLIPEILKKLQSGDKKTEDIISDLKNGGLDATGLEAISKKISTDEEWKFTHDYEAHGFAWKYIYNPFIAKIKNLAQTQMIKDLILKAKTYEEERIKVLEDASFPNVIKNVGVGLQQIIIMICASVGFMVFLTLLLRCFPGSSTENKSTPTNSQQSKSVTQPNVEQEEKQDTIIGKTYFFIPLNGNTESEMLVKVFNLFGEHAVEGKKIDVHRDQASNVSYYYSSDMEVIPKRLINFKGGPQKIVITEYFTCDENCSQSLKALRDEVSKDVPSFDYLLTLKKYFNSLKSQGQ